LGAPRFSVTSRRPSGRKAIAHGERKLATSVIANTGSIALASRWIGEAALPPPAEAAPAFAPAASPWAWQPQARLALSMSSRTVRCMAGSITRLYG